MNNDSEQPQDLLALQDDAGVSHAISGVLHNSTQAESEVTANETHRWLPLSSLPSYKAMVKLIKKGIAGARLRNGRKKTERCLVLSESALRFLKWANKMIHGTDCIHPRIALLLYQFDMGFRADHKDYDKLEVRLHERIDQLIIKDRRRILDCVAGGAATLKASDQIIAAKCLDMLLTLDGVNVHGIYDSSRDPSFEFVRGFAPDIASYNRDFPAKCKDEQSSSLWDQYIMDSSTAVRHARLDYYLNAHFNYNMSACLRRYDSDTGRLAAWIAHKANPHAYFEYYGPLSEYFRKFEML